MRRTLLHDLTDLQHEHGHLRREDLEALSRRTKRPLYELQGLLSFYPHFRTEPPPRWEVALCRDASCWLRDGEAQAASIEASLAGRDDVEVRRISCPGRCEHAPAATVTDRPCRMLDVIDLVDGREVPPLETPRRRWPTDPYDRPEEHYGVFRRVLAGELSGEEIVAAIEASSLRGMGGAGFPTGRKWGLVAREPATPKYVVCNADESEPGTFKDRVCMEQLPHLVLEGMLLGMFVVGASEGVVFIRHEYGPEQTVLEAEVRRARALGVLGGRFDIEVFTSPGGYILGEETALLDCLEGRRGEPRNKPPFPGTVGLWGKPTLMNNVETFHHVPAILARGVDWWNAQGKDGHSGWKFIAVSGHVERPGVYCAPMGTTVRELIDEAGGMLGGKPLAAFAPGGASSNFLPADRADVALDFDSLAEAGSMLGSGAMVAVGEGVGMLALATNVLQFFANESCGKCVPCRVGSHKAVRILEGAMANGGGRAGANGWRETIDELEETLRLTSICGLGQVALGPVVSVLRGFPLDQEEAGGAAAMGGTLGEHD
jgi:NADH:ubiquinone oxidoreductase subunit F (NADH-binding)/NADH:ubiquinone oxidoreductase subunit E